jgi:hypothetical protein
MVQPILLLPLSCRHRELDQTQVARHRTEIAVIVQQWPAVFDAPVPISRSIVLRTVIPRLRKERKLRAAATAVASPAIDTISKRRSTASTS